MDKLIQDKQKVAELINVFKKDGKDNFYIISDFDKTLTKMFVGYQKMVTVIGQVRNGAYLSPEYVRQAHALYDKYYPYEIDSNLSRAEKSIKMSEWWMSHFKLLIDSGFNKGIIKDIVSKKTLKFREGASEFLGLLSKYQIPLIILSAAPGDMIQECLISEGMDYNNIHIIANFLEYDKKGQAIAVKEPIIHSVNKGEIDIYRFPFAKTIVDRTNVIVMGDTVDDLDVLKSLKHKQSIKIGFLNPKLEDQLDIYKKNFDILILNDGGMGSINNIINQIL